MNVIRAGKEFQSLTGSIHTAFGEKYLRTGKEFQSLTGSIHTGLISNIAPMFASVSIPHRFNSHT